MTILLIVKQKKNVDTFLDTIRALLARGHAVTLAVQERHDERLDQYAAEIASERFSLVRCPSYRTDEWAETAPLLRSTRDCLHYQRPSLRQARKLQARTIDKLREDLRVPVSDEEGAALLRAVPDQQIARLERLLALAEGSLPTDPIYDGFLREQRPDVLLLSPLVHFGSAQADLAASASRLGIPVGMLLFSWDNLSTKGALHRAPDWMFVWNERQRREARELHDFPEARVVVTGAPRFDGFFRLRPQMTREAFLEPLGLDPASPTLLYVCSSPFVSAGELGFVSKWLSALRASASDALRTCNVLVRPHPDVALLGEDVAVEGRRWPALPGMKAFFSRPFDDRRAIVLRTSDRAQQGLFESIVHSAAVVGLNTSAELEAAIVGRPVFTVLADSADADGQHSTVHFHYLLESQGGCVRVASGLDEHLTQLARELATPSDPSRLRGFVESFLRPCGIDRPVAPLLAEAVERTFAGRSAAAVQPDARPQADQTGVDAIARPDPHAVVALGAGADKTAVRVYAASSDPEDRPRFDRTTLQWVQEQIRVGDVVCDVDAGIGLYSVLAAKQRGAVVLAFEPGYAAFKQLCDNVVLNGCDGAVMTVPLAVGPGDGLADLKFPSDRIGEARHALKPGSWRERRALRDGRTFVQMVCMTSLDRALERYGWPAPQHLRVGETASLAAVLEGAAQLLASGSLRTIFATMDAAEADRMSAHLPPGWRAETATPISRGRTHLLLARPIAATP